MSGFGNWEVLVFQETKCDLAMAMAWYNSRLGL